MFFVLIAHDNPNVLEKRMEVRREHLQHAAKAKEDGSLVLACALKDDQSQPNGSVMIFEMRTRAELDTYLNSEPYIEHKVWGDVEIREGFIPDLENI